LIVVVAIVAVMAKFGLASYAQATDRSRLASDIDRVMGDMQYARAEAMREGNPVTVCASTDGASCTVGSPTAWQTGWIVFSDQNGDGLVSSASDVLFKIQPALRSSDTITISQSAKFSYNRFGLLQNANPSAADIKLTASSPTAISGNRKCLFVTSLGRLSTQTGAQCS
jgi:type IV fimbrial biogenesis protein FimT